MSLNPNTIKIFFKKCSGNSACCILCHWGVQLILAYSWTRPVILVAGKGRGVMFLFLLFLHFHSSYYFFLVYLFHLLSISSICFLLFSGRRYKMTHKGWRVVKPQQNQSIKAQRNQLISKYLLKQSDTLQTHYRHTEHVQKYDAAKNIFVTTTPLFT